MTPAELDALCAERVLNRVPCDAWQECTMNRLASRPEFMKDGGACDHDDCYPAGYPPAHSTLDGLPMDVVRAMEARGFQWDFHLGPDGWEVFVYSGRSGTAEFVSGLHHSRCLGEATVKAALRALGEDV